MPKYTVKIDAVMRQEDGLIGEETYDIEADDPWAAMELLTAKINKAFPFPGTYPMIQEDWGLVGQVVIN